MTENDNEDRCQHLDGCLKSFFTYCPHCQLFLCINHLNQHHNAMKTDVNRMINEAEDQRLLLEQQIDKIKYQQETINNFYERELKRLNDMHRFVIDICENKPDNSNRYSLTSEYEKSIKQFESFKQEEEKNSSMKLFIIQIEQILQQQNDRKPKDDIAFNLSVSSLMDSEATIDISLESNTKDEEDSMMESIMDYNSNELSISDNHNGTDSDTFSIKSKWFINLVNSECPLSYVNVFGLSMDHNIPGVPCNFLQNIDYLTYGRCYYHLITYHRLRPKVGKTIMEILSLNESKTIDLTKLDTFSKWTSNEILSQSRSLFIGHCPLTQENQYGLQSQHNVVLCTPRLPPIHVYQHLRSFHHFKLNYAIRLINALIENEPSTKEIFKPDEQIINTSIRSKNRTRN